MIPEKEDHLKIIQHFYFVKRKETEEKQQVAQH